MLSGFVCYSFFKFSVVMSVTHTQKHARAHAHTHAHTYAYTHIQYGFMYMCVRELERARPSTLATQFMIQTKFR